MKTAKKRMSRFSKEKRLTTYIRIWILLFIFGMKLTHEQFKQKWIWNHYEENKVNGRQCVSWAKIYSKEVYGITLWWFWWTAHKGRLNKEKTFDLTKRDRVVYKPWLIPPIWAIIFRDRTPLNDKDSGHVAIVDWAWADYVMRLEQNWWLIGKNQPWDEFRVRKWNYNGCLWWYVVKKPKKIKLWKVKLKWEF